MVIDLERMLKILNNMKDSRSHFPYHKKRMTQFKILTKRLKLTERYISELITSERYNQDFEKYIIHSLDINYYCI